MADFIHLGNIDLKPPGGGPPGPVKKLEAYECQRCFSIVSNPDSHFRDQHWVGHKPMPTGSYTIG